MDFNGNEALRDALNVLNSLDAPWWAVIVIVALVMSPMLIPALSKALAEHRNLSHKREEKLLKIRNSIHDQRIIRGQAPPPQLPPPQQRLPPPTRRRR